MKNRCRVLVLTLWVTVTQTAFAVGPEQVREWLDRMNEAALVNHYMGTFVIEQNGNMQTLQVVHQARPGMSEYERIISLNGPARELHRSGNRLVCYLPDNQSVLVDKTRPRNPFSILVLEDVEKLSDHYLFVYKGEDRVATRNCRRVEIQPRDEYRYGYNLCLDDQTNLLLHAEVLNEHKEAVQRMIFTSIDYPKFIPEKLLQVQINAEGFKRFEHKQSKPNKVTDKAVMDAWKLTPPAGFTMSSMRPLPLPDGIKSSHHMVYSDGLASISIFLEAMGSDLPPMKGLSRVGSSNAYSDVIAGYQVVIVGDVPAATIIQVAESLEYTGS